METFGSSFETVWGVRWFYFVNLVPQSFIMQYILEVDNKKDKFLMELLKHFRFVKARPLTKANLQFINGLRHSVEEVKMAKKGKVKLQKAKDLLI